MDDSAEMPEETVEIPVFGPAALGLHRVGTALPPKPQPKPMQVLNARGMPARIRKKNRLFFDDDIVNDSRSMRRGKVHKNTLKCTAKATLKKTLKKRKSIPTKYVKSKGAAKSKGTTVRTATGQVLVIPANREIGQKIGLKLRNLLKLPKAHKWVIFEWFYSFIDAPLLGGRNEFQSYLDDQFPALRVRKLRRAQWVKIRQLLGKPRRCSQAFFDQERAELERRRQKIRLLQSKNGVLNIPCISDLPDEIPLPLPVGTKVTARLRTPQDGIFSGSVDAVDSITGMYRITFDRCGLGTHSIPDFEIMACDFNEMVSVASLMNDYQKHLSMNGNIAGPKGRGRGILRPATTGKYSVKLLEPMLRLQKLLAIKATKVEALSAMNAEAELQKPLVSEFSEEFQGKYASTIVMIERINEDIADLLSKIHLNSKELIKEPLHAALLSPTYLREKCRVLAVDAVKRNNFENVKNDKVLSLVTNLSRVLQVASHLTGETKSNVAQIMEASIEEVKNLLHPSNVKVFQKHVQIHLHHIRLNLEQNAKEVKSPSNKEDEEESAAEDVVELESSLEQNAREVNSLPNKEDDEDEEEVDEEESAEEDVVELKSSLEQKARGVNSPPNKEDDEDEEDVDEEDSAEEDVVEVESTEEEAVEEGTIEKEAAEEEAVEKEAAEEGAAKVESAKLAAAEVQPLEFE